MIRKGRTWKKFSGRAIRVQDSAATETKISQRIRRLRTEGNHKEANLVETRFIKNLLEKNAQTIQMAEKKGRNAAPLIATAENLRARLKQLEELK